MLLKELLIDSQLSLLVGIIKGFFSQNIADVPNVGIFCFVVESLVIDSEEDCGDHVDDVLNSGGEIFSERVVKKMTVAFCEAVVDVAVLVDVGESCAFSGPCISARADVLRE